MSRDQMAESEATSSPDADTPQSGAEDDSKLGSAKKRNSKSSKPRLTAVQKNTNHKDAENKRRTAIRDRFTELSQLVPEAAGQERSEQVMLAKTKDYLQAALEEIREMEHIAQQQGIPLPDDARLRDSDYGGPRWKQPHLAKYEKSKNKKLAKGTIGVQDDADGEAEDD